MRLEIPNVAIVHGDETVTSMYSAIQYPFTVLQIFHGLDRNPEELRGVLDDAADSRCSY